MKKLEKIIISSLNVSDKIDKEDLTRSKNDKIYHQIKKINSFFNKTRELSTEFEPVNGFISDLESDNLDDTKISVLYKQWNVEVYIENDTIGLENNLDFIIPYLNYEIIYQEPKTNKLSYYNTHDDLHTSYFYEIRENLLILHVSFYIKKQYGGNDLIIPNAKLRIMLKNPMTINN